MKKGWFRTLLGGLSFTSALFVFQACYGTDQDFVPDTLLEGIVNSKTSGLPINGIRVSVAESMQYALTHENGRFAMYTRMMDNLKITFEDIDSTQNGLYLKKDTVVTNSGEKVFLQINMEEK